MSSPTPGYYPDPSIPGYIRYWNGSAWVPGTSRPAPLPGEDVTPPPAAAVAISGPWPAAPAPPPPGPGPARRAGPRAPAVDESGPMFLDEDPQASAAQTGPAPTGGQPVAARAAARAGAPARTAPGAPAQAPRPGVPAQGTPGEPRRQGGGGPAPWAQQVHRLARQGGEPAGKPQAPWKPSVDDRPAAREQARPASPGRRLVARVLDSLVMGAVVAAAAVPLGSAAYGHIQHKMDQARQTGETVTVWLIDGTTGVQLGVIAAVAIVTGLVCEVLPTAKWGRTLGKKLLGLRVLDVESGDVPGFGAAVRRWLTHGVLDAVLIGFLGLAWCVFDRPWRQCWHDKAAGTFVARDS